MSLWIFYTFSVPVSRRLDKQGNKDVIIYTGHQHWRSALQMAARAFWLAWKR